MLCAQAWKPGARGEALVPWVEELAPGSPFVPLVGGLARPGTCRATAWWILLFPRHRGPHTPVLLAQGWQEGAWHTGWGPPGVRALMFFPDGCIRSSPVPYACRSLPSNRRAFVKIKIRSCLSAAQNPAVFTQRDRLKSLNGLQGPAHSDPWPLPDPTLSFSPHSLSFSHTGVFPVLGVP